METNSFAIDFTGRTAIVTGSTRGIGRAIADQLAELGCMVIYTGTKKFSDVAAGENREYWQLDASDRGSVAVFQERMLDLPRLDVLVNNAGINCNDSVDGLDDEDWDRVMEVNLTTPAKLMRAATKLMKNGRDGGHILNISSLFGVIGRPNRHAYTSTKTGLAGLTRSAALELAKEGIIVNALAPGFILTDMTKKMLSDTQRRHLAEIIPARRMGTEAEIAKFAVFLVSDINSYMVAQTVLVDGGISVSPGFG